MCKQDLIKFLKDARLNLRKIPVEPTEAQIKDKKDKSGSCKIYDSEKKWKVGLLFAKENTDTESYKVDD